MRMRAGWLEWILFFYRKRVKVLGGSVFFKHMNLHGVSKLRMHFSKALLAKCKCCCQQTILERMIGLYSAETGSLITEWHGQLSPMLNVSPLFPLSKMFTRHNVFMHFRTMSSYNSAEHALFNVAAIAVGL